MKAAVVKVECRIISLFSTAEPETEEGLQKLPLTIETASQHCFCVYQAQDWLGNLKDANNISMQL